MSKSELNEKLAELTAEFESKKTALIVEFCKLNNKVSIGDTITDRHGQSITVDRITFSKGFRGDNPECVYHGIALTKKMLPKKNGDRPSIYQSALVPK